MDKKRDNIYIYVWEELNTVYVGRTINPKSRHYQHRHRQSEATYQFSSEHHVEHPKMIIIENDLTIEEGVEKEKFWIKKYRDEGHYDVLNKSDGVAIGNIISMDDEEHERRKLVQKEKAKIRTREWTNLHREKKRNYNKIYRESHKEELKEAGIKYRELHKEEIKEKKKKWRITHKDEIEEYRNINKEKIDIQNKKYREENKEEINRRQKEYYQKNKEKYREYAKMYYRKKKINEIL